MKLKILLFLGLLLFSSEPVFAFDEWTKLNDGIKYYSQIVTTNTGLVVGENDGRIWMNPAPFNGVFISKDFGTTWQELGLKAKGVTGLDFSDGVIYASTYYINNNQVGLFKSDDNGVSWQHIGPDFSASCVSAAGSNVYLGGFSHGLWVSGDKGATWVQKFGSGFYGPKINMVESFENTAIASTDAEVYLSKDSGATWQQLPVFNAKGIISTTFAKNRILAVTKGEEKVYFSDDSGTTWELLDSMKNFSTSHVYFFANRIYAGIENPTRLIVSSDNGATWKQVGANLTPEGKIRNFTALVHKKVEMFALTTLNNMYKNTQAFDGPELVPFLRIPWNYSSEKEFVTKIYSHFDHEYPLLGYSYFKEPADSSSTTLNYLGIKGKEPFMYYSAHDGYDYALSYGTPILAAAGGIATYYYCGACGNTIKIDHQNGYQTTYMHLQKDGLAVNNSEQVPVSEGQQIGLVGMTGNTTGPHLHFAVTKTTVNSPDNRNDPYAWENSSMSDPWEQLAWNDQTGAHTGSKSAYLWKPMTPQMEEYIKDTSDTIIDEDITVEIPENSSDEYYTLTIKPYGIPLQRELAYIPGTSLLLEAYNHFGKTIDSFITPIKLKIKIVDIAKYIPDSLTIYYWDEQTLSWKKLPSQINNADQTVTAETNHLSHFAVIGQLLNSFKPETTLIISEEAINGWYENYPTVTLSTNAETNTIFYNLGTDEQWENYVSPILITTEGITSLQYRSLASDGILEETQATLIKIDTKGKWAKTAVVKNTLYEITAPPNTTSP